ncbi:phophatidylserine decarboxylase associated domain-containing protein [Pseudomonas soli]|uniref:phophatidylserine decarboxylase associated domain-containing protein n=1 Tax=Pseudomonas soli TaxID=1306993 RepID=UPI00345DF597
MHSVFLCAGNPAAVGRHSLYATKQFKLSEQDAMTDTVAIIPGYLPHVRQQVDSFLDDVKDEVSLVGEHCLNFSGPVRALEDLLRRDPIVRMYVLEMIQQVPPEHQVVSTIADLLKALQLISTRAPHYNPDPQRTNFFPVSTLFVYMMMTTAGQALFRVESFNNCIRDILKSWCLYLDSPQSRNVLHTGDDGWLSPSSWERNNLQEYEIPDEHAPHWGFESFNAFFHRQIKPACRPIDEPDNDRVVVSPNDGTLYKVVKDAKPSDRFWIKSQPYSLKDMLAGDLTYRMFEGGTVYQSFLDGRNYHRFKSPVAGIVRKIETIEGLMFSNAESAGEDLTAGTYSQAYMTCVNTRSLVFIESPDPRIGMVCLIAVGISEISSITINAYCGQSIGKGDELGYFSYGGSSICLLFQPGVIHEFFIDTHDTGTVVGSRGHVLKAGQRIALTQ